MRARRRTLASVALLYLLSGCGTRSVTIQELAGKYEYYQDNVTSKSQGTTCFTLHEDGTFAGGNTDFSSADAPALPKQGKWLLFTDNRGQDLDLDHNGFPIVRDHASIKALVNDDLGFYCKLAK